MMKKLLVLSLAILYTVTVPGFAINFHYCFNRVSDVTINQPVKMCMPQKLVKTPKCCKDKHIEVKVKDGHQSSGLTFSAGNIAFDLPYITYYHSSLAAVEGSIASSFSRGPPVDLSSQPALFLANRNFRI